jgi:hypothetical protein
MDPDPGGPKIYGSGSATPLKIKSKEMNLPNQLSSGIQDE